MLLGTHAYGVQLRPWCVCVCVCVYTHAEVAVLSLVVCDDARMSFLNMKHRGKKGPTDVLSFEMDDEFDRKVRCHTHTHTHTHTPAFHSNTCNVRCAWPMDGSMCGMHMHENGRQQDNHRTSV